MNRNRNVAATVLALGLSVAACMDNDMLAPELLESPEEGMIYFPGRGVAWEVREPATEGFDPALLEAAVDYAIANETETPVDLKAYLESRFEGLPDQQIIGPMKDRGRINGLIVRRGYIVAEWGDTQRVDMVFSVTKSFLATTVGVALDRGLIGALNDPVALTVDDGGYASEQNAPITWHHSLRQTSEWEGDLWGKPDTADRREGRDRQLSAPGTFWEYNDVRVNRLALSAARVWNEPLPEVLSREIMTPIGASRAWRWHGYRSSTVDIGGNQVESVSGGGHWGGGLWISTRDLARLGVLYARRGMWRDQQLLSEDWIAAALTPGDLNPTYGYMWWLNTDQALWPSAPAESFAARGGGDNLLWIDPSRELVVAVRWIQRGTQDGLLAAILAALEDTEPEVDEEADTEPQTGGKPQADSGAAVAPSVPSE